MRQKLATEGCQLTLLVSLDEVSNGRIKVPVRCSCGKEYTVRVRDLLVSKTLRCASCAGKLRMSELSEDQLTRLRTNAAKMKGVRKTSDEWISLRQRCQGVFSRCNNPSTVGYENYGGRGITVAFASATEMAKWVVENLGYPKEVESIDRIDNDRGYEPGNLRWADRITQANNKREKTCSPEWERVKRLQKLKPEFGIERIREFVKEGLTDDEIIRKVRTNAGRPRVRHP